MGFFDRLKAEFIDIIEWRDEQSDLLVYRFERYEHEIKMNAKLIVRPGQKAVFVNEGQIADVFGPGTHTLTTQNMPVLATLKGWKYGFESPFKAEVYFIRTTDQLDRKWGTPNPVMLRDADFGVVRLRARGNYAYRLNTDADFLTRFVGARDQWAASEIEGQLRTRVISGFSDAVAETRIPALELAANYDEISTEVQRRLDTIFGEMGLELISFTLENISLPEEVEKALDQRSSMGAIGNLNQFSQYQAAQAMRDLANNEGGGGGAQMMGMMMGSQMANGMGQVMQQPQEAAQVEAPNLCGNCHQPMAPNAKFCGHCGTPAQSQVGCIKCQAPLAPGAKFCGQCGSPQESKCKKCQVDLAPGAKFCSHCGEAQ